MTIQIETVARLVALVACLALVGCSDEAGGGGGGGSDAGGDSGQSNGCAFVDDGVCDEPANCALGTDEADCAAACEDGANLHLIAAACAHRGLAPDQPTYADPVQSGGTGGQTGFIDATLTVPSGTDLSTTVERHYRLYVPASYDPAKSYPLVINMAGHRVDHRVLPNNTQLPRAADLNDFIVVFAAQEFREGRWAWWTDWDWSGLTDKNPDFEFLTKLVVTIGEQYNLDRSRVYTSGHSRGAAMAFIAAIELDDLIAGAVIQSGFTEFGYLDDRLQTHDGRKPPLVFVHGIQDDDVCIDCEPGGQCAVTGRQCAPGMHAADAIVARLESLGWQRGEDLVYYRLDNVAHRWQSQLNQQWWDFLSARPLTF